MTKTWLGVIALAFAACGSDHRPDPPVETADATAVLTDTTGPVTDPQGPAVFIDRGACPFECCRYGRWFGLENTVVLERPDTSAPAVGTVLAGDSVTALTGEVHTLPTRFVVHTAHTGYDGHEYTPGDVLWVTTYLGEGFFRVRADSADYEEELGFSPGGGTPGRRCEADRTICFGELERELPSTWWIRVETPDGTQGWTRESEHFSGLDGCG